MRIVPRFVPLALLLAAAACDESPVTLPEPTSVAVASTTMALAVGDQAPVAAQVMDQNGRVMEGQGVVYSTDNASVATVARDGTVRGVAPGTANVSAAHGASTATVRVTVTAPTLRVAIPNPAMLLTAGGAAPLGAQVLDANGRPLQGAVLAFSSDNPTVATVGADGIVRGTGLGTTRVTAAYGSSTASVQVTVGPDRRNEVQVLEIMADSMVVDVRAGVQVVAVRALNGLGQAVCPALTFRSTDRSVATARAAGTCRIEIVPAFSGQTTITIEAEGMTDDVRVRVTSVGATAFFSARPTSEQLVAGATVAYSVRVLNQAGHPVVGQRVNLEASTGGLSATTVVTDSTGAATVQWSLPRDLREAGQTHSISLRAQLPNGQVVSRTESVFINGASLAQIALYRNTGGSWTRISADTITAPYWNYLYLGASGVDQYGNVRVADFTFSLSGGYWGWSCGGSSGTRDASGIEYTCFYSGYNEAVALRATASDGQHRTVHVRFTY